MAEENVGRKLTNAYWDRESVLDWARELGRTEVIRTAADLKNAIARSRKQTPRHTPSYTTIRRLMGDEGLAPVLQAADELNPWDRETVLNDLSIAGRNDIVRDANDLERVLSHSSSLPTLPQLKALMGEDGLDPAIEAAQSNFGWNIDKLLELVGAYGSQLDRPITVPDFRRAIKSADPLISEIPTWQTVQYFCNTPTKVDNLIRLANEMHGRAHTPAQAGDNEVTEVYRRPTDEIPQPAELQIAESAGAAESQMSAEEEAFYQAQQGLVEELIKMRDTLGRRLQPRDLVDAGVTMDVVNNFFVQAGFTNLYQVSDVIERHYTESQGETYTRQRTHTMPLQFVPPPQEAPAYEPEGGSRGGTLPMGYLSNTDIDNVVSGVALAPEHSGATEAQLAADLDADHKTTPGLGFERPVIESSQESGREDTTLVRKPIITAEAIGNEPEPSADDMSLEDTTNAVLDIMDRAQTEEHELPDTRAEAAAAEDASADDDRRIIEYQPSSIEVPESERGSDCEVVDLSAPPNDFERREPTSTDWMRDREKSALMRIARKPNVPQYVPSEQGGEAAEPTDMPAVPTRIAGGHYETVSGEIDFGGKLDVSDVEAGHQEDKKVTEDSGRARLLSGSTADSITSKLFEDGSSTGAREIPNPLAEQQEQQGSGKKTIPLAELQRQAKERGIKTMDMFEEYEAQKAQAKPAEESQAPDSMVIAPENGRGRVHTPSAYTPSGCGELVPPEADTDPSIPAQKEAAETYSPPRASRRRTAAAVGVGAGLTAAALAAVFGLTTMSNDGPKKPETINDQPPALVSSRQADAGTIEDAIMSAVASAPPSIPDAAPAQVAVATPFTTLDAGFSVAAAEPAQTYTPEKPATGQSGQTDEKGLAPSDPRNGCNLRLLMEFDSDEYSFASAHRNLTTYALEQMKAGATEFYVYGTASIEDARDRRLKGGPVKDNSPYNRKLAKLRADRTKKDIEKLAKLTGRKVKVHAIGVGEQDLWAVSGNLLVPNRGVYISTMQIPVPGTDVAIDDVLKGFNPNEQHGNACIGEARATQPVKHGALPSTGPGNRNQRGDEIQDGPSIDVNKVKELYFAYTEGRVTWEGLVKGSLEAGLADFSLTKAADLIDSRSEYLAIVGLDGYSEFEKESLTTLYFNHVFDTDLTDEMIERSCRVYGLPRMNRATVESMYAKMTGGKSAEDSLEFEIDVDEIEFLNPAQAESEFDLEIEVDDSGYALASADDFEIEVTKPMSLETYLADKNGSNGSGDKTPSEPALPLALGLIAPAFRRREDEYEAAAPIAPESQEPDYTAEQVVEAKILQFQRESLADMIGSALVAEGGVVIYDGSQSLLEDGTLSIRDGVLTPEENLFDAVSEAVDAALTDNAMYTVDAEWDTVLGQAEATLREEQMAKAEAEWDAVLTEADAVLSAEPKDAIDEVREMFVAAKGPTAKLYEQKPEAFVFDMYTQFGYSAEQIDSIAKVLGVEISVNNGNFQELMTKGGLHNITHNVPALTAKEKQEIADDLRNHGQYTVVMAEIQEEIARTAAEQDRMPLYNDGNRDGFVYDMVSRGADLAEINRTATMLDIEHVSKDEFQTLYKRGGMKRLSTILSEEEKQIIKVDIRQLVEEHNVQQFREWAYAQDAPASQEHKGDLAYELVSQGKTFAEAAHLLAPLGMDQQAVYDAYKERVFTADKVPKYTAEERVEQIEGLSEIRAPYELEMFFDDVDRQARTAFSMPQNPEPLDPEPEPETLFTVEGLERFIAGQKKETPAAIYNMQN
ncbi:hypothetical protein KY363_01070 [Candidatus Woesearchaeota archaeon]|nr:hypothetical protein [Candidatus Woesearchaeota archaeon]